MHDTTVHSQPGYLVWFKIPEKCFGNNTIDHIIMTPPSPLLDQGIQNIRKTQNEILWTIRELKARGITHIRTGVSMTEWNTPGGRSFIRWYIRQMSQAGLFILPDLTYTPHASGIVHGMDTLPRHTDEFADFVGDFCRECGSYVKEIELWNEPNSRTQIQAEMVRKGAIVARRHNKVVVLGGIAGNKQASVDCLGLLADQGVLEHIDVIGLHNLRYVGEDAASRLTLPDQVEMVRMALGKTKCRIWFTEYGFPTTDPSHTHSTKYLEKMQVALFADATMHLRERSIERIYWYTLKDLVCPTGQFEKTESEDHLRFHYGDTRTDGTRKLLGRLLRDSQHGGSTDNVVLYAEENNLWYLVGRSPLDPRVSEKLATQYLSVH